MISELISYIMVVVAMIAMAAIFVYRPEKYKKLPYIVVSAMMLCMFNFTSFFDDIGIWFVDWFSDTLHMNRGYIGGRVPLWIGLGGFAAIPVITLLVMMIVRTIKEKKNAVSEEESNRIEPEKPVETTTGIPKNANNKRKGKVWCWIGGIVLVTAVVIVAIFFMFTPSIEGALPGKFSVGPDKQVQFSKGTLQYQASTNTWRFAKNQWDIIGEANKNISSSYDGWIDLFYGARAAITTARCATSRGAPAKHGMTITPTVRTHTILTTRAARLTGVTTR